MINEKCGVMEIPKNLSYIINKIALEMQSSPTKCELSVDLIPKAKDHNDKPMIHIGCGDKGDVEIWHIEISEEGIFAYEFDDGVS